MNKFVIAVLATATLCHAEQEFMVNQEFEKSAIIPQIFSEDEGLEMLLQTYNKYHTRLDFDGGFQTTQPVVGFATTDVFGDAMRTSTF